MPLEYRALFIAYTRTRQITNYILPVVDYIERKSINMKKTGTLILFSLVSIFCFSQSTNTDSLLKAINTRKESALRARFHADSLKIEKEFFGEIKMEKLKAAEIFPVLNAGEYSGIIPVKEPTEIPDTTIDYKLLFELTADNPDSLSKDRNQGLVEVARVINLHVASGIPVKKIFPVIVIHRSALNAITTNEYYKKKYNADNPNLQLISDLEKLGAKFIACGQAMAFLSLGKKDLLPEVKVSLTAQTVITGYQLKGYVWMSN